MVLQLRETREREYPSIGLPPDMVGKEARYWTELLLVHSRASRVLRGDLDTFISREDQLSFKDEPLVLQFLLSIGHHIEVLLERALKELRREVRKHWNLRAKQQFLTELNGDLPSLRELFDVAEEELGHLWSFWLAVTEGRRDRLSKLMERGVPTSSPRTILIRLLLRVPAISEMVNDATLVDIGRHLDLQRSTPTFDSGRFAVSPRVADGMPAVFFICRHPTTDGSYEFYVGSSKANWGGLSAIGDIRRRDRDDRLDAYIPFAEEAYNALKKVEKEAEDSIPERGNTYEIRRQAIVKMRKESAFLGRTTETGQAFDKSMNPRQCCYVCQGMMGYRTPAVFEQQEIKTNLCQFDWDRRRGYAHSCAEIDVSLQCSINWEQNSKGARH
ncbi:hypothetical protein GP486_003828 [Trichoglossum hirsutum]|uniref:Uncharacterized protein n=1 Tax=Trichoglossum hirsutum TaxID=265104 RepID=A0A9P8LCD6_9PEZI|nr:hypothetical protein GP486_003828 [Trichoglossum hirsutum]